MGRGLKDPLFFHFMNQLSPAKKESLLLLFEQASNHPKKFRGELNDLLEFNGIKPPESSTMMEVLINNWFEHLNQNEGLVAFSTWLDQINKTYSQKIRQGELNPAELEQKFQYGLKLKAAADNWLSKHGVNTLPVKFENGTHWVQIKETWFKCSINEKTNSIRILVPREIISRAAWNPIYSEVVQKKLADGVKPPAQYPAFVGANGLIYPTDGNHRLIIDGRKEVWIEMSYPARTASFSNTFDAIGIPQPSIEKLLQFDNKEIDLPGLIGADSAARFIYF